MKQSTQQSSSIRRAEDISASHYVAPVQPLPPYHTAPMTEVCSHQYVLTQKMVNGQLVSVCEHRESYDMHVACPADSTLIEGQCVKVTKVEVEYQCPEGFARYGTNQCISHHECPIHTACDDGIMGPDGKCTVILRTVASPECPSDSVLINDVCHNASPTKPRISCPVGFNAVGIDCVKKVDSEAILVCPDGTNETFVNGVLVCRGAKVVEWEHTCPPGELLKIINGVHRCAAEVRNPAQFTCPPGWEPFVDPELDNTTVCQECHKKKPDYFCEYNKGERLVFNQTTREYECISLSYDAATKGCPTGADENAGRCILTEDLEQVATCQKSHQELVDGVCQEILYETLTTDCEGGNYDPINEVCYTNNTTTPSKVCPANCQLIPKTDKCFCETTAEAVNYCPSGCHMIDDRCEKDSFVTGKALCPAGFGYSGMGICEKKEVLDSVVSCHNDDDVIEGGFCIATKTSLPTLVCPDGYVQTDDQTCVLHSGSGLH